MLVEWTPEARAAVHGFMRDQDGMRAIGAAVAALAGDPEPPGGFHRGEDYHRLRVGPYRVMYRVEGELITVWRIDRT